MQICKIQALTHIASTGNFFGITSDGDSYTWLVFDAKINGFRRDTTAEKDSDIFKAYYHVDVYYEVFNTSFHNVPNLECMQDNEETRREILFLWK